MKFNGTFQELQNIFVRAGLEGEWRREKKRYVFEGAPDLKVVWHDTGSFWIEGSNHSSVREKLERELPPYQEDTSRRGALF